MIEEILKNKGCVQNTAKMLMDSSYPDVTEGALHSFGRGQWAANKSYQEIRKLRRRPNLFQLGLKPAASLESFLLGKSTMEEHQVRTKGKQGRSAINTDSVARGESIFNDARLRSQQSPQAGATGIEQKNGVSFCSGWGQGVSGVLHGWGQVRANNPCFIKEWWAYKQTYHSMTEDNIV